MNLGFTGLLTPEHNDENDFRRINDDSIFCSRKAAKLAKKNNEMNLLKKLCVFASLREIFSVPVYPGYAIKIIKIIYPAG